jgi:non-homologous end joining protein Ku
VVLSDEQIRAAHPKTTQTIEIEAFGDITAPWKADGGSNVVDLTALLTRSLAGRKSGAATPGPARAAPRKSAPAKRPARKRA